MADLRLRAVESASDLRRFIDVPWRIPALTGDPRWVPPLRVAVRDAADAARNPLFADGRGAIRHWIAERGGRPVGRIAAIENRAHNDFHGDRMGFFGFFECAEDRDAARALVGVASEWVAGQGLEGIRGPTSPSTNYETGVLVDGFDARAYFMTPWNPPYYDALMTEAGLHGAKDLIALPVPIGDQDFALPERWNRLAEIALRRSGVVFRDIDLKRFDREVELIWEVYNSAWEKNWGFVPMNRAEFDHLAGDMRHLVVGEFGFLAFVDDEPVAFALVLPDFAPALRRIGTGRLLPTGWWHLARAKNRIRHGRISALGIKAEYRRRSILPLFAMELYRRGQAYGGEGAEVSWVLEDNEALIAPLRDDLGLEESRRWRVYESEVAR